MNRNSIPGFRKRERMGLKNIIIVTVLATIAEWFIYIGFQGRYGIEVDPKLYSITIPFMLFANFIAANIAQYIFTGRVSWKL
jgi:hypothetical protein